MVLNSLDLHLEGKFLGWFSLDLSSESDDFLSVSSDGLLDVFLSTSDDLSSDNLLLEHLLLGWSSLSNLLLEDSNLLGVSLDGALLDSSLGNSLSDNSLDDLDSLVLNLFVGEPDVSDVLSAYLDSLLELLSLGWLSLDLLLVVGDLLLVSLGNLLGGLSSTLDDSVLEDLLLEDSSLWLGSLSILLLEDSNLLVDLLDGLLGSDSLSNDLSDWGSLVDLLDELLSDDLSILVDDVDVSDNLLGLGDLLLGSDLLSWLSLDDFLVSVDLVPLLLDSFLHEWPTTLDDLSFDDLFPDVLSSWLGGLLISLLENLDDLFLLSDELRFENLSWSVGKNSLVASSCSSLSS